MVSKIIGCKSLGKGDTIRKHYYINNGIYKGYMVRQFGEDMFIDPLEDKVLKREQFESTWWGQTCDSCDWVIKDKLHHEMRTGEWVISKDMGAYHTELGCQFNGFDDPTKFYIK